MNKELKDGFSVAVTYGDKTVVGADLFASKLTAMKYNAPDFEKATTETSVYLKNKDNKYLVFDASLNGTNAVKGGFKLVSEADAKTLAAGASAATAQFTINVADNGTNAVQVLVDTDKRLYVNVSNGTNVLTALNPADLGANAANWAGTALGASNTLDFKTLLTGQFVKVNYVKTGE